MASSLDSVPDAFEDQVHKALRCWHHHRSQEGLLDHLLLTQLAAAAHPATPRETTNRVLKNGLARLSACDPMAAKLLRLRFYRCLHVSEATRHLHYAESTLYHKQNEAIHHLAEVLSLLEVKAWRERALRLESRLAMPDMELVGAERHVAQLVDGLAAAGEPWLVSLEGPGGIGKTALAAAVLRRLVQTNTDYYGFGWISAEPAALDLHGKLHRRLQPPTTGAAVIAALARQLLPHAAPDAADCPDALLPALHRYLHEYPHVIVIDCLEAVADGATLLRMLHLLANPAKFVLTSRRRLLAEPGVCLYSVPELSAADSLALLRRTVQAQAIPALIACDDEELLSVYTAVGGNPLALLFVVGQTHTRPLHAVLDDLPNARTLPAALLFDYLFGRAVAELDQSERRVLNEMLLAEGRGLDVNEICSACSLSLAEAAAALQGLYQVGLISATGDLDHCRCSLSDLARTCLRRRDLG